MEHFAADSAPIEILVDVYDQAKQLLVNTYSNKSDNFESCADIATLNTFLTHIKKSALPKLLPPTT